MAVVISAFAVGFSASLLTTRFTKHAQTIDMQGNANAVLCTKLSAAADACGDKPKWLGNKLRDLAREFA